MRMQLRLAHGLLALGIGAMMAACSDSAVGPSEARHDGSATAWLKRNAGARAGGVTSFVYNPDRAERFRLPGGHEIFFPRRAVCDPATSTYGVTEWDKPCAVLREPITITAQSFKDANGRPYVDFSPALRFVPDPKKEVVLSLRDKAAAEDSSTTINWCGPDGECVDESLERPELSTRHKAGKGVLERVIKHFSGYNISVGRSYPGAY
jgi:hypothetical protein